MAKQEDVFKKVVSHAKEYGHHHPGSGNARAWRSVSEPASTGEASAHMLSCAMRDPSWPFAVSEDELVAAAVHSGQSQLFDVCMSGLMKPM